MVEDVGAFAEIGFVVHERDDTSTGVYESGESGPVCVGNRRGRWAVGEVCHAGGGVDRGKLGDRTVYIEELHRLVSDYERK